MEIKLNQIIPHNGCYISYKPAKEDELYSFLVGICNNLEYHVIKVSAYTDHIHILCMLSQKVALMKLLEELKSHSSKWMKTKGAAYTNFSWQNGYGAFSVNPSQFECVIQYIANQKEHHHKKAFKTEYQERLENYEVVSENR